MKGMSRTKDAAMERYRYGLQLEHSGRTEKQVAAILGYAHTCGWQVLKRKMDARLREKSVCKKTKSPDPAPLTADAKQPEPPKREHTKEELLVSRLVSLLKVNAEDMLTILDLIEEARQ